MDASTIVDKINQQLNEREETNAITKEPAEPLAARFHFLRPDSSMKIAIKIAIDDSFKVQVLENNILEIRNNKEYMLLDTSYIVAVEIRPRRYL